MVRLKLPANAQMRLNLLAILVGIITGFGAWIFRLLIALSHNLAFYQTFDLSYNANLHSPESPLGAWIILSPVAGAIVVAFLVKTFAPEAKGHGVPEVIDAIYYNRSIIRPMVAGVKALASSISIGTGGAVGREGPIIQIGAAFGSTLGQIIHMKEWQRMVLVAAGVGSGIAATFNTPLGGILFAIELMLVEISARTLIPVGLATGSATFIGRIFFGVSPSFDIPELAHATSTIMSPHMFLIYILFGCILGLAAMIYSRAIYATEDLFERIPGNYYTRHMMGMLLVGFFMYAMMNRFGHYYIQGVGYATIQDILVGTLSDPALLALLFVGKLLTNSLTLGSGGSGGIFSPSLFLGATLGAAFGVIANSLFPGVDINPAHFAVIGMAAIVGAGTGAVITAIVMIFEMVRDYNVIIPLIITVSIAYGMRRYLMTDSIYIYKLMLRGHYIPDSLGTNMFMLRPVEDFIENSCLLPASEGQKVSEIRNKLKGKDIAPYVLLTEGKQIKSVMFAVKRKFIDTKGHRHSAVRNRMTNRFVTVGKKDILFDVLAKLRAAHCKIALVTPDGKLGQPEAVIGAISLSDIAHSSHLAKYIISSKK